MKLKLVALAVLLPLNIAWAVDGVPPQPQPWPTGPYAAPPYAAPMPGRYQPQGQYAASEAGQTVREGLDALMEFLKQEPRPTEMKVSAFLEEKISPYFDFERMAEMVMGPQIQSLTKEQRIDLVQTIQQDFLRVMATHLSTYDSQRIRYFRPHQRREGFAMVTVGIMNPNSYPSRLDFRLYKTADGWKVYDVEANGSSAIRYYRQRFAGVPQRPYAPQR
jgi:phospholipid transport system substrate-binding protein